MKKGNSEPIKGDLIRKQWRAGKKTVLIDGRVLKIRRVDNFVHVKDKDGKQVSRVESWLVASPTASEKVWPMPVYNVALGFDLNSRVTR
jgi:hypothetical protein